MSVVIRESNIKNIVILFPFAYPGGWLGYHSPPSGPGRFMSGTPENYSNLIPGFPKVSSHYRINST